MDFISALWNDPLTLRRLGVILQRVAIAFVLFGGVTQFVKHIIDERVNRLNTDLTVKNDQERRQRENELEGKLQNSREELGQVRTQIVSAQQKQVEAERVLDALRNYSVVARLNPLGLTGTVKPPLTETSSLSEA